MSIRSSVNYARCNTQRGFTLLEVIVALGIGLTIGALVLGAAMSNKSLMNYDVVRTRIDQNLRSAMDIVSSDLRVGGENLTSVFPAFEVIDGTGAVPDELIIRRNLVDEVLNVCVPIAAGSAGPTVQFADPGAGTSGCVYSNNLQNFASWQSYRLAHANAASVFIYDISSRLGEFFSYTGENDSGTALEVSRAAGTWTNSYSVGSASVYILEERHFRLNSGILEVVENGDTTNPLNIVAGLTNLQVVVHRSDSTTASVWNRSDRWNTIDAIEVTLTGEESFQGKKVSRSLSSSFFPRNVLSQ